MSLFLSNKAIIKKSHNVKLRGPGISESSLICCNLEADWWIISNLEPTENLDWQNKFHRTMPSFHWVCGIIFTAYSSHSCDLHLFQQRSHILGWFVPFLGTRCIWALHHLCAVLVGDGAQHWPSTAAAKLEQRCPASLHSRDSHLELSACAFCGALRSALSTVDAFGIYRGALGWNTGSGWHSNINPPRLQRHKWTLQWYVKEKQSIGMLSSCSQNQIST